MTIPIRRWTSTHRGMVPSSTGQYVLLADIDQYCRLCERLKEAEAERDKYRAALAAIAADEACGSTRTLADEALHGYQADREQADRIRRENEALRICGHK